MYVCLILTNPSSPLSPPLLIFASPGVLALVRALERPLWGALLRDLWPRANGPLGGGPRPAGGRLRPGPPLHVRRRGEKLVGASALFALSHLAPCVCRFGLKHP